MQRKENFKAYLAWFSICIIWGTTYLAIRIGVEDLPPVLFAGLRWLIAGPVLLIILKMRGMKFPTMRELWPLTIISFALLGLGNGFVVFAEQWVPSGLTALLITTVPFWIVGIEAIVTRGRNVNPKILAGLALGISGVVLIFWGDLENLVNPTYLGGIAGLTIGVLGWSAGSVYSKYKKINVNPLMGAAVQMSIAGILMTAFGISIGELNGFAFTNDGLFAFLYLIIIGSFVGYTSYIYALAHLPVSFVSTYAYVNPVIALFLGWLVLDEKITTVITLGAVIILAGVAMVKYGNVMKSTKY